MKHARPDYDRIQDPAGVIPEDEPVFLLRAQDVLAPAVVRAWADSAEANGAEGHMVAAARHHARQMERWQGQHGFKVPDMPKASLLP
jgi:hypothetical protein